MKKQVWLVVAESGIHFGNCVLGVGASEVSAIADANGGGDTRLLRGQYAVQMDAQEAADQYPDFEDEILGKAV
jgi:hypothetical protein